MARLLDAIAPFDRAGELNEVPYQAQDASFLTPILKRTLWQPALKLVPRWMSANTMTIISNLGSLMAFALALLVASSNDSPPGGVLVLIGLSLFFYLSVDNMDGAQARRTGTSGPFGEFIDHWFDCFNVVLIVFAILLTLQIPHWLILALLAFTAVSWFALFWEQRVTGWLIMGAFGGVEGIFLAVGLYLLMGLTGMTWLTQPLMAGMPSLAMIVCLLALAGYSTLPLLSIRRVRSHLHMFVPFLVPIVALMVWYFVSPVPFMAIALSMVLTSGYLAGRLVISRVTDGPYRGLDPVLITAVLAPIIAQVFFPWSQMVHTIWVVLTIAYTVIRLSIDFVLTVYRLRHHLRANELLAIAFPAREERGVRARIR